MTLKDDAIDARGIDATILGYGWTPMPTIFPNLESLALHIAKYPDIPSVDDGFRIARTLIAHAKQKRWPRLDYEEVEKWMSD